MPIIFLALIGFMRFVIGHGRKLSWVRNSLVNSGFIKKQEPLNNGELMNFLVKSSGLCQVHYPSPAVKWIVGKNWFPLRGIPVMPGFSDISIGWASHFMPRPQ